MGCVNVTTKSSHSKVRKFTIAGDTLVKAGGSNSGINEKAPVHQVNDSDEFQALDYKLLSHSYSMTPQIIGTGYYGKVLLGYNKSNPELKVAIKTLEKKRVAADIHKIKNEAHILSRLDHPNICRYFETYESPNYIYLVMEYCQGGDLFHRLTNKGNVLKQILKNSEAEHTISETTAREIMKKLFLAINHCHSNNIIHRDLKPENIMLSSPKYDEFQSSDIKIIDFGLGRLYNRNKEGLLSAVVGTSYYVAPEVLEGKYGFECDCWSLGVIMYVLLSGHLPFPGRDNAEVFLRIKSASIKFSHKEFGYVSDQAKDLIIRLLDRDQKTRYTCFQALEHPWFTPVQQYPQFCSPYHSQVAGRIPSSISIPGSVIPSVLTARTSYGSDPLQHQLGNMRSPNSTLSSNQYRQINSGIVEKLRNYQRKSSLQQEAMTLLVKMIDSSSGNGQIENTQQKNLQALQSTAERKSSTYQLAYPLDTIYSSREDLHFVDKVGAQNGTPSVAGFHELREVFSELDLSKTGMLHPKLLKEALNRQGFILTQDEVASIIGNLDSNGNGKINYTDFLIATLEVKPYLTQDMLMALFRYFDTDSSGLISSQDLRIAFKKQGKVIQSREVRNIMQLYSSTVDENNIRESSNMKIDNCAGSTLSQAGSMIPAVEKPVNTRYSSLFMRKGKKGTTEGITFAKFKEALGVVVLDQAEGDFDGLNTVELEKGNTMNVKFKHFSFQNPITD